MTKRATFQAAICGREGSYGVVFPDFLGCTSGGSTLDEAAAMAHEALTGHIEVGVEYGDEVPDPGHYTLAEIEAEYVRDSEPGDPVEIWVALIPVTVDVPSVPDRVRIDVPRELADEVRSHDPHPGHFIVEATRRELARLKRSA